MAREPDDKADAEPSDAQDRQVTVSFLVPENLRHSLKVRAAQERTTVRGVVLRGLKAIGFEVPDDEMNDRRPGRAGRPKGR